MCAMHILAEKKGEWAATEVREHLKLQWHCQARRFTSKAINGSLTASYVDHNNGPGYLKPYLDLYL